MKRAVGPLVKRKLVTRCEKANKGVLSLLRCQGGFPCEYCNRAKSICAPQAASPAEAATLPLQSSFASSPSRRQFSKEFVHLARDLMPLMQTSPSLRDLAIAIGALDAGRRESPQLVAYCSYGRSLQSLQQRLKARDAAACDDVAWISFLLGLFELNASQLMSESSAEGWAKHMFYGTSKRLFGAFRVLEVNRAILYGDATFLSENKWRLHRGTGQKHAGPPD
ncbi:hypothetical protein J3F83DRAFT_763218 [Trichoderma novae-zelandiae]